MTIKTLDDKGLPVWGQLPLLTAGRWRSEPLERWSADEFDTEAERLREEREDAQGAA